MPTHLIMRRWRGTLVPVSDADAETLETEVPADVDMEWTGKQLRSGVHHRFFFGLLALVWKAMPEQRQREDFGGSVLRMRKWLTVEAGYAYISDPIPAEAFSLALIQAMRNMDESLFFEVTEDGNILIKRAKSIAFASMDQRAFKHLCDAIIDIIITRLLPSLERNELIGEVERMTGVDYSEITGNQHG